MSIGKASTPARMMPALDRVKSRATYELVVEQIRRALLLGRFKSGDRLPPERELAAQLSVSRTTLREALRVLEGEGLLEVRRGARGGVIVLGEDQRKVTDQEREEQAKQFEDVMEFRLANECAAARLAARNRTDEHVATLRRLVEAFKENESQAWTTEDADESAHLTTEFVGIDNEFHLTIALAGGNQFLYDAVELGRENMLRPVGTVFGNLHQLANFQHAEIAEAIIGGDEQAAADSMAVHLRSTRTQVREALGIDERANSSRPAG